ncbi:MAG: radical SAM protein, partial [Bryobacteraceae bacterium]
MQAAQKGNIGRDDGPPIDGKLIVLTAPLTETIDHAGYFIQMALASLPNRLEGIINQKYPKWRDVERNEDGTARFMPAGVRLVETSLLREFSADDVVCCYPDDLPKFVGTGTRVVGVSTHNPLGVTFAAGVYASIFGSSREPINSHYAKQLFQTLKDSPHRANFKVIVGGSGGWQISKTNSFEELSVDCVVDGRSESEDALELFRKAVRGEQLPRSVEVSHPTGRAGLLTPGKRTTFGVVEMTTGCGRRCQFCVPDLNPQIDFPKDKIMEAVRVNVREGNSQVSLATEDMFIWGQVHTDTPFYFPNREALLDLFGDVVNTPGVKHHLLSHCTMAPSVVDPKLIEQLSAMLLDKSPVKLPSVSTHPEGRILSPLIGMETGSVRMAKQIMPGKAVPFPIEEWPSVLIQGLTTLNRNNWFPVLTLMIGNPGETDADCRDTLDLLYEVERRGLFAFFVPSIFTPLQDTRLADAQGVLESREMSPLQWQIMMKCWKMSLKPALQSWWGPSAWRLGALGIWLWKLRKLNGPNFT